MKEGLYIQKNYLPLTRDKLISDTGGEAYVYNIGNGKAAKVYKNPDDPEYEDDPLAQEAAQRSIRLYQRKLMTFPRNLPEQVIAPQDLAYDEHEQIIGYTMSYITNAEKLSRLASREARDETGMTNNDILKVFRDLHYTVSDIHEADVVIGDFNDSNVLVKNKRAYLIDADSFQFGRYPCAVFQDEFIDPLLLDYTSDQLALKKDASMSPDSDWYAFNVMFLKNQLFAAPYDGIYKRDIPDDTDEERMRLERRLTIFSKDVTYPTNALHFSRLPDTLLDHFEQVFEKDKRGPFPAYLLDMRWTNCNRCGAEHARDSCPQCSPSARKAIVEVGKLKISTVFERDNGQIITAVQQKDQLRYLYYENGQYKREDGAVIVKDKFNPNRDYSIQGKSTLLHFDEAVVTIEPEKRISNAHYVEKAKFMANSKAFYWILHGKLYRDAQDGELADVDIPKGEQSFWVGEDFGLYCTHDAEGTKPAFVFDAEDIKTQHNITSDPIKGQLLDTACYFGKDLAWLLTSTLKQGKIINQCTIINKYGKVVEKETAEKGEIDWLDNIHGKCAVANTLHTPTSDGILSTTLEGDFSYFKTRNAETKSFVTPSSELLAAPAAIYVVNRKEIKKIEGELQLEREIKARNVLKEKQKDFKNIFSNKQIAYEQVQRNVSETQLAYYKATEGTFAEQNSRWNQHFWRSLEEKVKKSSPDSDMIKALKALGFSFDAQTNQPNAIKNNNLYVEIEEFRKKYLRERDFKLLAADIAKECKEDNNDSDLRQKLQKRLDAIKWVFSSFGITEAAEKDQMRDYLTTLGLEALKE